MNIHSLYANSVIPPDIWIIEEELRKEREKNRRKNEGISLPLHLPFDSEDPEPENHHPKKDDSREERVVIIDL